MYVCMCFPDYLAELQEVEETEEGCQECRGSSDLFCEFIPPSFLLLNSHIELDNLSMIACFAARIYSNNVTTLELNALPKLSMNGWS